LCHVEVGPKRGRRDACAVKGEEERVLPILVVALRHAELVGARHAIDLDGSRSGGDGLESTAAALRSAARACRTRAGRRRSCARRSARSHHSGRLAGAWGRYSGLSHAGRGFGVAHGDCAREAARHRGAKSQRRRSATSP
jgi:hypothetical protein